MVKKKKKSSGVTMDFSETQNFWRPVKVVEAVLECTSAEDHATEESLLVVNYKVVGGRYDGKETRDNLPYAGKGAFRLRNLLDTLGIEIDEDEPKLSFEDLVGQEVGAIITPYEWDGKPKVKFDYCSVEDLDTDDDEVPAKKGKKAKDEEEDDVKPAKKKKKPVEEEEEEEDEEEPKSKKGKKASITQEDIRDMDDDELEAVIKKNKLGVDLSDFKTLKKQQAAVIDACEEAGILAEE